MAGRDEGLGQDEIAPLEYPVVISTHDDHYVVYLGEMVAHFYRRTGFLHALGKFLEDPDVVSKRLRGVLNNEEADE